jgi:hypothetical protein
MAARQKPMIISSETLTNGLIDNSVVTLIIVRPTHWFGCFSILGERSSIMKDGMIGMMIMTMMTMQTTVTGTMARISHQVPVSRIALVEAEEKEVPRQEPAPWHHGTASGIALTTIGVQRSGPLVCLAK